MRAAGFALAAWLLCSAGTEISAASMSHAQAAQALAALAAARQQVETADYRLAGRLVRVDANGKRISDNIGIAARWFPGVLRVFLDIKSPAAARAHVLLEMRADGRVTIRIAHPSNATATELPLSKWAEGPLGDTFSYEDFLGAQYFWPGQKDLGQTQFDGHTCDPLLSTPGPTDRTHYASVKSCLDPSSGFPLSVEKTVKGSEAVKEFTYFGIRRTRGVWWANQVEAKIRGRPGSTLLIVEHGTPEAHLGLNNFDPTRLTKF